MARKKATMRGDLERLLYYLWEDEEKDYEAHKADGENVDNHVYTLMCRLNLYVRTGRDY